MSEKSNLLPSIQKSGSTIDNITSKRSTTSIAKLTENQNRALKEDMACLDKLHTDRMDRMTGKFSNKLDPETVMRETDNGFKLITARLNKVIYTLGNQKLEPN